MYVKIINCLKQKYKSNKINNKITILFLSYVKNSHYIKARKQNTVTLIYKLNRLTFFVVLQNNYYLIKNKEYNSKEQVFANIIAFSFKGVLRYL